MLLTHARKWSRWAPVVVGLGGGAWVGAIACGGAAPQDALESTSTSTSSASGGTSGTSGASGGTSGASGGTSGGTSGASGGGPDAAADAPAGDCTPEMEPNDTPETANVLAPSRCGAIQPNSESDFLTFVLQKKTTSMQITFTGKVTLRVTVAGQTVTLGTGTSPKVPFMHGEPYLIEIKAIERGTSIPWRVDLIEQ